ncbi:MAG: hypothetical protein JXR31_03890 [Prolixibacteraceae bacterium]|nr:hypothetical protein [Prolixibacteraceae bacterium]
MKNLNYSMKMSDEDIKKRMHENMLRIHDKSFTERIVNTHLATGEKRIQKPFFNFSSLIIALSAVLTSIGLIIFALIAKEPFYGIEITQEYGIILLILSFIFLIHKWLDGILFNKN